MSITPEAPVQDRRRLGTNGKFSVRLQICPVLTLIPVFPRTLGPALAAAAKEYPVVGLMGPRQSGKSTLARAVFADLPYVNLESPQQREFATTDPVGFLRQFPDGVVLDEIQRAPDLPSSILA